MEFASPILDPVCERLISAAVEEYKLVSHVKEDIKKLKSFTVPLIKNVLRDAEEKLEDETVGTWHRTLKEALFDYEDILDEVATKAALQKRDADSARLVSSRRAKVRNVLCSCFGAIDNILVDRHIAIDKKRLEERSKEIEALKLQSSVSKPQGRLTSSLLADESHIIGRDDEKEKIKKLLLESVEGSTEGSSSSKHVGVISIIGMGGLGKTTLVKLIYNDPTAVQHFQVRMWVCVSNHFDVERITGEMLDDRRGGPHTSTNWDRTQTMLKEKIEGKRFVLVLDDMWEDKDHYSKWESLIEPLSYGDKESKIVVTTRSQKVSHMVKGNPVFLENLSTEHLWTIFERYAFEGCDSGRRVQLETPGKQIVEKLKGSPLAAKIVGRLLNSNLDEMYWESILNNKAWVRQSRGEYDILPILKLSYDHLPGHLKQCFAYCSLFPEDYPFSKDGLLELWMAQNFIQIPKGFHTQHFNDLLHASFFQQSGYKFVMHDLIHDLAESVSADDCFRRDIDESKKIPETVRHVSIVGKNFDPTRLKEVCQHEKLRTLLFFCQYQLDVSPHLDELFLKLHRLRALGLSRCMIKVLPESIGNLIHLRYIDLSGTDISKLPESIGNLIHLRYIDLSETDISKLPESICNLHNLQVMKLYSCGQLSSLPSNMSVLINLRRLDTLSDLVSNIRGVGKLTALENLRISGRKMRELAAMDALRELEIFDIPHEDETKQEAIQAKLGGKKHLDKLELSWSSNDDGDCAVNPRWDEEVLQSLQPANNIKQLVIRNYGGAEFPSWINNGSCVSFPFLETVELAGCRNWEALPPLGRLPRLKILGIEHMKKLRHVGLQFLDNFPSLEELLFYEMPEWEEWDVLRKDDDQQPPQCQQPSFLSRPLQLRIYYCPKLRQLPPLPPTLTSLHIDTVGLTHLPRWLPSSSSPSLSSLDILRCPNLASLADGGLLQQPLQNLVRLNIQDCENLVSLPETAFGHLTSLSVLNCPKISWPTSVPQLKDVLPSSLKQFSISAYTKMEDMLIASRERLTALTYLQINGSFKQTGEYEHGALPSSLERLYIEDNPHLDEESLSKCLQGLTTLGDLSLANCSGIIFLPGAEMLSHLTSLQSLTIRNLEELTSLGGIHSLISLQYLHIFNCPMLLRPVVSSPPLSPSAVTVSRLQRLCICESSPEQIRALLLYCNSLQKLEIKYCDNLTTCFDGDGSDDIGRELEAALLKLAPSLHSLTFWFCKNLCSLPSKLKLLSSLEYLEIVDCPEIQCLPSAGLPESLVSLRIGGCPTLKQRCKRDGGPDWPLISHVRDIYIR